MVASLASTQIVRVQVLLLVLTSGVRGRDSVGQSWLIYPFSIMDSAPAYEAGLWRFKSSGGYFGGSNVMGYPTDNMIPSKSLIRRYALISIIG